MKKFYILLLSVFSFYLTHGQNNLWRWNPSVNSGFWTNTTNWQTWNGSAWVTNTSASYPTTSTQTVVVDLSGSSSRSITVDNNAINLSSLTIINNTSFNPVFILPVGNTIGVINTFSVGGIATNSLTIFCSTPINTGSNVYTRFDGGAFINFKPAISTTITPIFNNVKLQNVGLISSDFGTTTITENNLSPQSFTHNSGMFNLIGKTLNCKGAFNINPVSGAIGVANLLGSTINAGHLTLASTSAFSFSAQTTSVNLTDYMSFGYCSYQINGNNAAAVTSTLNSITFNNGGVIITSVGSATSKIIVNTINSSQNIFVRGLAAIRIKNFNLTQPLTIENFGTVSTGGISDLQGITTAASSCSAPYNFIGTVVNGNPSQLKLTSSFTVGNMNFRNVVVSSGTITTTNAVDMGFNTNVIFSSPLTSYGATTSTWNGSVSTDWHNANNWTPSTCVPNVLTNVIIPSGTANGVVINRAAFCYNLTTTGTPTVVTFSPLTVGGNFTSSAGTNFNVNGYISLAGIKPATNYTITTNGSTLQHTQVYINAHNTSQYALGSNFTVDYPGSSAGDGIYFYSGKFKTNGFTVNTNVMSLDGTSLYYSRSLDVTGSTINFSTASGSSFSSFVVNCNGTTQFNTAGSRFFFGGSFVSRDIIRMVSLPASNTLFNFHNHSVVLR